MKRLLFPVTSDRISDSDSPLSASPWLQPAPPGAARAPWLLIATVTGVVFATGAALSVFGEHYLPASLSRPVVGPVPLVLMAWLLAAPLVAALAVAASTLWSARRGMLEQINTLTRLAERLASGDTAVFPQTRIVDPDLRTLGGALSRLAELRDAASGMLIDRDTQLAAMRNGNGIVYWESDLAGRFTRLELPQTHRHEAWSALLGRTRWDDGASAAQLPSWEAHRSALSRLERFEKLLVRRVAADGSAWYALESGWPRFGPDGAPLGYAGTMVEMSLDEATRCDHELALAALGASSEPGVLIRRDGSACGWSIVDANAAACRLLDRNAGELRRLDARNLFDTESRASATEILAALDERRSLRTTVSVVNRFGDRRSVWMRLETPAHGDASGMGALLLDERGPELERLQSALEVAEQARRDTASRTLELEIAAKELESFSYTVSHDLRAPLRVVEGFAKIVQEDYAHLLDRVGNEHLNRILSASGRMNSMIDALMALSRLSSQPIVPQETDLSRIAEGVVDELRTTEPERSVQVAIEPGLRVRGDAVLLRSVLQNLLSNAWKYSGRRADASISLSSISQDGQRVFVVSDNGVGFDMRFADRLFGVFQRLHSATDFPGNGVGLATVQRIVRRHGGRVWADARVDGGSRFYFTLWDQAAERAPEPLPTAGAVE